MNRVIVTGACGFIGCKLIEKLLQKGMTVLAIDRIDKSELFPQSHRLSFIQKEVDKIEELIFELDGKQFDTFYHLAWKGVNGTEKADPIIQIQNIQMTIKCAKVAKQIGCTKFLCAGTIAEWNIKSLHSLKQVSPSMLYGIAKDSAHHILEAYCKSINLIPIWMQFSNIYGSSNKTGNLISYTIDKIENNEAASFGPAMQPYDFIYVDDLIEAVCRLGEKDTKENTYCISSGASRLLKEYLNKIGEIYGREDLIRIGVRDDDGIRYSADMFNNEALIKEIGEYTTASFEERIAEMFNNGEKL